MVRKFLTELFDLLIPPRASDRLVRALTAEELAALGTPELPYHDLRVKSLVWEIKYHANPRALRLAGAHLAELLLGIIAEELGVPLLIPVPMHAARRRERGHNQTELLCEAILPHLGGAVTYAPQALARMRHTPTQQGLHKAERVRNVAGAMEADPAAVAGRVCIVLDDVATTGATLAEATRALRLAGARAVHAIALAKS